MDNEESVSSKDATDALRYALGSMDIAPEGFNDLKVENFKRFKSVWPKEFPPIEPNTPMWIRENQHVFAVEGTKRKYQLTTAQMSNMIRLGPPEIPKQLPTLPEFLK